MKILVSVLIALALSGCGPNTKPDSRTWTTATCSGFAGWEVCNKKASESCPKGYDVANQEESQVAQKRTMQFSCK